jgi:hypothetical protein
MGLPIKKPQRGKNLPSQGKAKQMMDDGTAHGKPMTTKQRGLMAIIATGMTPTKVKK